MAYDNWVYNVSLSGSNVILANGVTVTGAQTANATPVNTFKSYAFEVWGTATSFTLHIEAVGPSNTPRTINKVWDALNNAYLSSAEISTAGFYSVDVPPFTKIQANIDTIAGGNVSVEGGLMQ